VSLSLAHRLSERVTIGDVFSMYMGDREGVWNSTLLC